MKTDDRTAKIEGNLEDVEDREKSRQTIEDTRQVISVVRR